MSNVTISGEQNGLLREALESAFPTQGKLEVMLRETLARDLEDVAGENYRERILDLIQVAESQGWKIDLIAGARSQNPGNPKLQNFINQFIESLFSDDFYSVSSQLGQRLIQLLQQVSDFNAVVHALRSTLPIGFEDHCRFWVDELQNFSTRRALQIFALLKLLLRDYPQIGILPFVNQLVSGRKLEPSLQQEFQRWLIEAQTQTGQILPQVQQDPSDLEEKHPCLFVEVKESLSKRLSFYLKASFSVSGSKVDLEPFGETQIAEKQSADGQCEFTHTRTWINQLLDRAEERLSAEPLEVEVRELTLEVFLPCEHLLEAIDQWQIESEPGTKMGRRYQVVMRAHDRLIQPRWSRLLKQSWQRMQKELRPESQPQTREKRFEHLACLEECRWEKLELTLAKSFGLKLTCVPSRKDCTQVFATLFKSGAPIAFWTRCNQIENLDLSTEMDRFLSIHLLKNRAELLEQIRQERENAYAADVDHLGNHLAILWDDPSRVPLEYQFKAG